MQPGAASGRICTDACTTDIRAPPVTFDTIIRGGEICTTTLRTRADIGIREGRIAAIDDRLTGAETVIDATGHIVLPGGIETHAHIAQESAAGVMNADDYFSGSVSAAFGGNSSFVPFAAQQRGQSVGSVLDTYGQRAARSVIDYSWHLIISDPTPEVLTSGLPMAFERGVTSFKVFMTYDLVKVDDRQFLDILTTAGAHGAVTMVHAENDAMVRWMNEKLAKEGKTAPRYHAESRPALAEEEAIHRAVSLAKLAGAPLFVVHVSTPGGAAIIAREKAAGTEVFAETCPHYLAFTAEDLDRPGMEGAKFICSPPLRDAATQKVLWENIAAGTFDCVSSDHAPYRFDETGKFINGAQAPYPAIANGMPGIGMRLPWLFSEGVVAGRISLQTFAGLSATNAARVFGLDTKGNLAPGLDADIAIWDPEARWHVTLEDQHDNMDYTPFEGMEISGRPVTVLNRGLPVIRDRVLCAAEGQGRFIARKPLARAT